MSVDYVNNFDLGAYGFELKPCSNIPTSQFGLVGFHPALDRPTQFLLPGNHLSPGLHWGDVHLGSSCPDPSNATVEVEPSTGRIQNGNLLLSNGAVVKLNDMGVGTGAAAQPVQSKTAYLLPATSPLLAVGTLLRATLHFDMPTASGGTPADVWAVALNFKTGTKDDGPADQKAFVTCQFSGGGNIRFHGTTYNAPADPGVYAQFSTYPATEFSLCVEIALNGGKAISGTGRLTYGNLANTTTHTGQLNPSPAGLAGASITAVGAAVVTTSNGFTSFGARLRSFCLEIL